MNAFSQFTQTVLRAVRRARNSILTIALTYFVFVTAGIVFVSAGSPFALAQRDQLVGQANQQDQAAIASNEGNNLRAALLDFGGNLFIGAVPKTLSGLSVLLAYPLVAYQGWVGGIVSVNGDRISRFADMRSAMYYLLTLILQLLPYSLAVGAGVNVGISMFRPQAAYQSDKWLKIFPTEALLDVARIYALAAPLLLLASLWEFLSPWNLWIR